MRRANLNHHWVPGSPLGLLSHCIPSIPTMFAVGLRHNWIHHPQYLRWDSPSIYMPGNHDIALFTYYSHELSINWGITWYNACLIILIWSLAHPWKIGRVAGFPQGHLEARLRGGAQTVDPDVQHRLVHFGVDQQPRSKPPVDPWKTLWLVESDPWKIGDPHVGGINHGCHGWWHCWKPDAKMGTDMATSSGPRSQFSISRASCKPQCVHPDWSTNLTGNCPITNWKGPPFSMGKSTINGNFQ